MDGLDDPARYPELRDRVRGKPAVARFYEDAYRRFARALAAAPGTGAVLELGSGAGFLRDLVPEALTSDVIAYPGLGVVLDGMRLPFADGALRAVFMLNVFHHVPDVERMLAELARCVRPGGRVLIVDQHPGVFAYPILRWAHHEPFRPRAEEWRFDTTGPLSGANGALAWMVFRRDRTRFESLFPQLEVARFEPHTPLLYWLSGGLKGWSLVPRFALGAACALDRLLCRISPRFGSFLDVELVRRA